MWDEELKKEKKQRKKGKQDGQCCGLLARSTDCPYWNETFFNS